MLGNYQSSKSRTPGDKRQGGLHLWQFIADRFTAEMGGRFSLIALVSTFSLTGCGTIDRDHNLRFWESYRYQFGQDMRKHHYRSARKNALEALGKAQSFGSSDFRLGVSLCDLGDVYRAEGTNAEAVKAYKRSIQVFDEAAKAAPDQLLKDLANEDKANSQSHLADLYASNGDYEKAAQTFSAAAQAYEPLVGISRAGVSDALIGQELVQCLLGLAQVSTQLKKFDEACRAYDHAMRFAVITNCPEFLLREIRDSYIKLLNQLGKQNEARSLVADALWSDYTGNGLKAFYGNDYHAAEIFLTKALEEAQLSQFGERRMMKSYYNLVNAYIRQEKDEQALEACQKAIEYRRVHSLRADRDFDNILTSISLLLTTKRKPEIAIPLLEKQLAMRMGHYGAFSVPTAETLSRLAICKLIKHDYGKAKALALRSYDIVNPTHLHDKRAAMAVSDTATVLEQTGERKKAELLYRELLKSQEGRMDPGDVRITGQTVAIIMFYCKGDEHAKASKLISELLERLKKANSFQRANAMPYIELATSVLLSVNWYDEVLPLAIFGQSLIKNELGGAISDPGSAERWQADLKKLEAHFRRKL